MPRRIYGPLYITQEVERVIRQFDRDQRAMNSQMSSNGRRVFTEMVRRRRHDWVYVPKGRRTRSGTGHYNHSTRFYLNRASGQTFRTPGGNVTTTPFDRQIKYYQELWSRSRSDPRRFQVELNRLAGGIDIDSAQRWFSANIKNLRRISNVTAGQLRTMNARYKKLGDLFARLTGSRNPNGYDYDPLYQQEASFLSDIEGDNLYSDNIFAEIGGAEGFSTSANTGRVGRGWSTARLKEEYAKEVKEWEKLDDFLGNYSRFINVVQVNGLVSRQRLNEMIDEINRIVATRDRIQRLSSSLSGVVARQRRHSAYTLSVRWNIEGAENLFNMARSMRRIAYRRVQRLAPQIQEWMYMNAPWVDRTWAAREGLRAYASQNQYGVQLTMRYTGIDYDQYLEFGYEGRYSIITPAMLFWQDEIMNAIGENLIDFRHTRAH